MNMSQGRTAHIAAEPVIVYARASGGRWHLIAEDGRYAGIVSGRLGALGAPCVNIRFL